MIDVITHRTGNGLRIYKNRWFIKFAGKEEITDAMLCTAVNRACRGLTDADLGSGVLKQRIAREGEGKSGGYRTIMFFRAGDRAVFVYGFAKKDRDNLEPDELAAFRKAAKIVLALSDPQIAIEVETGRLAEVKCGGEDL